MAAAVKNVNKSSMQPEDEQKSRQPSRQPTLEEVKEAEKIIDRFEKHQAKKRKKKKVVPTAESSKKSKTVSERDSILDYLTAWESDRDNWKFQKLKQVYLQNHMFDDSKIDDDLWPLALNYLSSSKGASKEFLNQKCLEVIEMVDEQASSLVLRRTAYNRARELYQMLQ